MAPISPSHHSPVCLHFQAPKHYSITTWEYLTCCSMLLGPTKLLVDGKQQAPNSGETHTPSHRIWGQGLSLAVRDPVNLLGTPTPLCLPRGFYFPCGFFS